MGEDRTEKRRFPDLSGLPIAQMGNVKTAEILFDREVRTMCENNLCGNYGKNWACPPATGTLEECRQKVLRFEDGIVFNTVSPLEDSFDWPGMVKAMDEFHDLCMEIKQRAKNAGADFLLLAAGSCRSCETCAYPDAPCRCPENRIEPIEGQGIFVNDLTEKAKINYINGENTVTFIGMLLY